MAKPHPKTLRPDITFPSPDPLREPHSHEYKKGDEIIVKPGIHYQGYDLSNRTFIISSITGGYIIVEVQEAKDWTSTFKVKLLRYEIEPADIYIPDWISKEEID